MSSSTTDTAAIVRRSLFFIVLTLLTLGNIFIFFRGLNTPQAMDQAQIAREIARGNGFSTKFIRPAAYYQAQKSENRTVSFLGFRDTYHSPLNPLLTAAVLKVVGADKADSWQMANKEMVYPLDRVVAGVSVLFFLLSIGVTYLLLSRIFDLKIAGIVAILMLFSEMLWSYATSGLPQMLMLFLFSSAIYFVYRAVEANAGGRLPMVPALMAAILFTLLALTHWLTVWIALGYIIYIAIAFKPRGVIALSVAFLLLLTAIFPILRNLDLTGNPFGTAFLTLYSGLGGVSEDLLMRSANLQDATPDLSDLFLKIARSTLLQLNDIIAFLGGIVIAPLFFIALLHPFRRASIAHFRWAILLMFVCGAIGLSFFGIAEKGLDPNQIHLLFAPVMAAYGIAFISVIWNRLEFVSKNPSFQYIPQIIIIAICALPMILAMPQKVRFGMNFKDSGGIPHWPPYFAPSLNLRLKSWVKENEVVFSDQPWAVAWYADRPSVWLPSNMEGFNMLDSAATEMQTPSAGILISPLSNALGPVSEVAKHYKDFASLVLDGRVLIATYPPGLSIYEKDTKLEALYKQYPHRTPLVGLDMAYYSKRLVTNP